MALLLFLSVVEAMPGLSDQQPEEVGGLPKAEREEATNKHCVSTSPGNVCGQNLYGRSFYHNIFFQKKPPKNQSSPHTHTPMCLYHF